MPRASRIHNKSVLTAEGRHFARIVETMILDGRFTKHNILHELRLFGLTQGEADDIYLAAEFAASETKTGWRKRGLLRRK